MDNEKFKAKISHESNFDELYTPQLRLKNNDCWESESNQDKKKKTSNFYDDDHFFNDRISWEGSIISCDDSGCHC